MVKTTKSKLNNASASSASSEKWKSKKSTMRRLGPSDSERKNDISASAFFASDPAAYKTSNMVEKDSRVYQPREHRGLKTSMER